MNKKILFGAIAMLSSALAFSQQALVSTGSTAANGTGSTTYVVGQMINQANDIPFGVLQVIAIPSEGVLSSSHADVVISVYPNPATHVVQVRQNGPSIHPLSYQVMDLQGRQVVSGSLSDNKMSIDLTSLANQPYLLHLHSNEQLLQSYKIIKQ